jgi:hypothetical protein
VIHAYRGLLAMPIRQYFLGVGSFLLAALFAANWWIPAPVARPHSEIPPNQRVNLRIRSDHKWPERVVFDTTHSGLSPAAAAQPAPDDWPGQEFADSEQRGPLNAFAEMESTPAAPAATNDKATATQAKHRPERFRMTKAARAD